MNGGLLSKLNPFSKRCGGVHDDDHGDVADGATVAGGGHGAPQTEVGKRSKKQLRVSTALRHFLVNRRVLAEGAAGECDVQTDAERDLLEKPHVQVPPWVTDRSHPLPEYFISSSHNTYLVAHQLFGQSSAEAYRIALETGSRCIELDAWDNDYDRDEPKITHGYTLVSRISFRAACEAIRDVVDRVAEEQADRPGHSAAPILLALENHCDAHGQQRLVHIMTEVWGDRLLTEVIREPGQDGQDSDRHLRLDRLGSKICVMVEYHLPGEAETGDSSDSSDGSSSDDDVDRKQARAAYRASKKAAPSLIIPALARLGVYAQSVKPVDNSWFQSVRLPHGPHHHVINLSETALASHLPAHGDDIARHNARHLMRVFPKGSRISSRNLSPVPFWAVGAHMCALNCQTFGTSLQLNQALFAGTDGYVLKPAALRPGGDGRLATGVPKRLRLHLAGATDVPLLDGHQPDAIRPYATCTLFHPDDGPGAAPKRRTAAYRHHHSATAFLRGSANPPATDPIWHEVLEWDFDDNELVFVRILIKSDDLGVNPILAVAAVRLLYLTPDWTFIRMLDRKGRETDCTLLARFETEDA